MAEARHKPPMQPWLAPVSNRLFGWTENGCEGTSPSAELHFQDSASPPSAAGPLPSARHPPSATPAPEATPRPRPSRTRHAPPSPRASRAARPGKARARKRARAHQAGSRALRNLPAAGSPGSPASAPAFWRVGGEPARSGLFSLSCSFCPTCQRLARVSSARRGSTPELPFRNARVTWCFLSAPPTVPRHTAFPLGH